MRKYLLGIAIAIVLIAVFGFSFMALSKSSPAPKSANVPAPNKTEESAANAGQATEPSVEPDPNRTIEVKASEYKPTVFSNPQGFSPRFKPALSDADIKRIMG